MNVSTKCRRSVSQVEPSSGDGIISHKFQKCNVGAEKNRIRNRVATDSCEPRRTCYDTSIVDLRRTYTEINKQVVVTCRLAPDRHKDYAVISAKFLVFLVLILSVLKLINRFTLFSVVSFLFFFVKV